MRISVLSICFRVWVCKQTRVSDKRCQVVTPLSDASEAVSIGSVEGSHSALPPSFHSFCQMTDEVPQKKGRQSNHDREMDVSDVCRSKSGQKMINSLPPSPHPLPPPSQFQFYQRNLQRQGAQQLAWVQKRRAENSARRAAGEEVLPEEDPTNPIFKPIPEPSRIDSFLITNQISNYCQLMNK